MTTLLGSFAVMRTGDPDLGRYYRWKVKPVEEMDTEWVDNALCKGEPSSTFFFDEKIRDGSKRAKEMCSRCPVTWECLQYAMDAPIEFGIWGGLTANERWHLRRRMRNRP